MKIFLHVLNTWFASIVIAFLILCVSVLITEGIEEYSYLPDIFFIALLVGIPSFFISWFFLALIQRISYSSYEKLFLWLLAALVTVGLNIFILWLIVGWEVPTIEDFVIFWPAYAGVVVTILLRLKQFFSLINKTTHHETNMV